MSSNPIAYPVDRVGPKFAAWIESELSFVQQITSVERQAAVVVMGDLNDFWFAPPLAVLEAAGLHNPMLGLPAGPGFSGLPPTACSIASIS